MSRSLRALRLASHPARALIRRFPYAICLLVAFFPAMQASALSPGELVVDSIPGKPLKATISLTLLADEDLARLKVSLASAEEYARQNLQPPRSLQGLRAVLLANGENAARIRLYGEQPWQGEEAVLLLNLQWPGGEMIQRYRIAPAGKKPATPLYVEVAQDESLADIAIRLSRHSNHSYLHMMVALFRANPDAFYRDNLNYLKAGARLRVPDDEELYKLSDAEVNAAIREHEKQLKAERQQSDVAEARNRELEQKLQRVTRQGTELEQRNRELKERLAKLERQVNDMSQQVLEYTARSESEPVSVKPTESQPPEAAPVAKELEPVRENRDGEGLSTWQMMLLSLLVLVGVILLRRFVPRRGGETQ